MYDKCMRGGAGGDCGGEADGIRAEKKLHLVGNVS